MMPSKGYEIYCMEQAEIERWSQKMERQKYRLWDKIKKVMHYNNFVITPTGHIAKLNNVYNLEKKDELLTEQFLIDQTDLEFEKDKILMSSIGLEDENGNLIYRNDILQDPDCEENYLVVWDEESASFRFKQGDWLLHIEDTYLVIGNIYENPELLESCHG